jgi:hypothetical protein
VIDKKTNEDMNMRKFGSSERPTVDEMGHD